MTIIKDHPEGILLAVTVQPRASRSQIAGVHGDTVKIKLTAPPVEGAANKMCIQMIAKWLGLPQSAVEIVSGRSSRRKMVLIRPKAERNPTAGKKRLTEKVLALAGGK